MTARIGSLATVSLLGAGCIAVHYVPLAAPVGVPVTPPVSLDSVTTADREVRPGVHRPGITSGSFHRVEVTREGMLDGEKVDDHVEQNTSIAVRVQAASPLEVAGMWFGDPASPPCQGGHHAIAMSVDDNVHWERPLVVSGTHVVAGRFDEDAPLLDRPSVVDLRLADAGGTGRETCVRVPVTGPGVVHWVDKSWSVGARLAYRRALPFDPGSTFALGLSVGHWLGPIRLGLEGFIGGANESPPLGVGVRGTSLCFFLPGEDCNDVGFAGFALESSGIAWRKRRLALGWSISYELLIAKLRRHDTDGALVLDRTAIGSGFRLGVQVLRPVPGILGASPYSPTSAWGLELFVAAPVVPRAESGGAALTWGVAVLGF